jgi:hypothetical protein
MQIHRPVFDALIGERKEGSVQVDWTPREALPAQVDEEIDFDGDGQTDFRIVLDTQTLAATLTPYAPPVMGLESVNRVDEKLVVRVQIRNLKGVQQ